MFVCRTEGTTTAICRYTVSLWRARREARVPVGDLIWACRRAPRSQRASMAGARIERPTTRETTAFAPELVVLTTIARRRADELEMAAAIDHDGGAGADREMGDTGEDRGGNVVGFDRALQRGRLGARFERRAVAALHEIGGHRAR